MSKFDKYFRLYVAPGSSQTIDFPVAIPLYDRTGEQIYLTNVTVFRDMNNNFVRSFTYRNKRNQMNMTSIEEDILTEDEIFYLKTKLGKLIYG